MSVSVEAAYATCESIARREAKNFYYAFRVLPKPKRAAICAVYAFMRHADDLADDERVPREKRLEQTRQWIETWHRAASGDTTDDPVFIALRDAQRRFQITTELLDQLVQGTMMDLTTPAEPIAMAICDNQSSKNKTIKDFSAVENREKTDVGVPTLLAGESNQFSIYRGFDELYQYCYYVASVVGLVCIRIFGYSDPRAESLAEQTGIAFQLTNILRDVREDAERGRIYLPLEDLRQFNLTAEQLAFIRGNQPLMSDERALMEMEVKRARNYYTAAYELMPLIAPDSRAALWVLVTIYRRLLERIVKAQYQVFGDKIRVSTPEKIWILLRGSWMAFRLRRAGR